jgi:hypothetical protein
MLFILYLFLFYVHYVCSILYVQYYKREKEGTWPPFIFVHYTFLIDAFDSEVSVVRVLKMVMVRVKRQEYYVLIPESLRVNCMEYYLVDSLYFSVVNYYRNSNIGLWWNTNPAILQFCFVTVDCILHCFHGMWRPCLAEMHWELNQKFFTKRAVSIEFLRSLSSDLLSPGFGCSGTMPEIEVLVTVYFSYNVLQWALSGTDCAFYKPCLLVAVFFALL